MIEGFFSWRSAILKSALPPTTRHVLLTLSCHMNDAGESCYPSIDLLSAETGLSRQSVMTHLEKAAESGWIRIEQHGFKGQKWRRNDYKMAWPFKGEGGQTDGPPRAEGGQGGLPPLGEGGQPHQEKVVKEVDSSTSVNSTETIDATTEVAAPVSLVDAAIEFYPNEVRWRVDDAVYDQWLIAYQNGRPFADTEAWIESELAKAANWLIANPRKRKKNLLRFLNGWLTRASQPQRRPQQFQARAYH